jgi:hypothetical protein
MTQATANQQSNEQSTVYWTLHGTAALLPYTQSKIALRLRTQNTSLKCTFRDMRLHLPFFYSRIVLE